MLFCTLVVFKVMRTRRLWYCTLPGSVVSIRPIQWMYMSGDCLRGTNSLLRSSILYLGRADAVQEARMSPEAAMVSYDSVRDPGQNRG